ncbi:hypothetical protein B0H19DRAFT_1228212 [Mycena capillaripes]|nr:hypothetical protein B0H19DRAFT_1228212 [Mycena capillaripes]
MISSWAKNGRGRQRKGQKTNLWRRNYEAFFARELLLDTRDYFKKKVTCTYFSGSAKRGVDPRMKNRYAEKRMRRRVEGTDEDGSREGAPGAEWREQEKRIGQGGVGRDKGERQPLSENVGDMLGQEQRSERKFAPVARHGGDALREKETREILSDGNLHRAVGGGPSTLTSSRMRSERLTSRDMRVAIAKEKHTFEAPRVAIDYNGLEEPNVVHSLGMSAVSMKCRKESDVMEVQKP